jgi:hypothetical protein
MQRLRKIAIYGWAIVRRVDSNCIFMTLEKLLTVLMFNTGSPGGGARMRKITILGSLLRVTGHKSRRVSEKASGHQDCGAL